MTHLHPLLLFSKVKDFGLSVLCRQMLSCIGCPYSLHNHNHPLLLYSSSFEKTFQFRNHLYKISIHPKGLLWANIFTKASVTCFYPSHPYPPHEWTCSYGSRRPMEMCSTVPSLCSSSQANAGQLLHSIAHYFSLSPMMTRI